MWWLCDRPGRDGPVTIKRHGWATTDEPFLRLPLYPFQIALQSPLAKFGQRITRASCKHLTRDVQVLNLVAENTIEHRMIGKLKFMQELANAFLALCREKLTD